jgi:hypothetical protein
MRPFVACATYFPQFKGLLLQNLGPSAWNAISLQKQQQQQQSDALGLKVHNYRGGGESICSLMTDIPLQIR